MRTYLFDITIKGIIDSADQAHARQKLQQLGKRRSDIYVDEYADLWLEDITEHTKGQGLQCQRKVVTTSDAKQPPQTTISSTP